MKLHASVGPTLISIFLTQGVKCKMQSGVPCVVPLGCGATPVVFCGLGHTAHTLTQEDIKINPSSYVKYLLGIQDRYGGSAWLRCTLTGTLWRGRDANTLNEKYLGKIHLCNVKNEGEVTKKKWPKH